jgi:hypothetical protein
MLFDAFISHASEDKDDFVRPLAERLRENRIEVWFDEFSFTPGMSLRRSIDQGLAKSRHGIVVLSSHFFGKAWPEWELNGLVQRHMVGPQNALIPIWHHVNRDVVAAYSPPLADIVAVSSDRGLDYVVGELLRVLQPDESALVVARNLIIDRGYEPPVISDDWWLDALEGSGHQHNYRWCFPIWRMTEGSSRRGESLAWVVMQHLWQQEAENRPITQMTPPGDVVAFIQSHPGLREICCRMPCYLMEFAPQLAIPGLSGDLEDVIERSFQRSVTEYREKRTKGDPFGTALTTNGLCPACEDYFALRHPTFGDYEAGQVACGFVQGNGAGLGPHTRAYPIFEYLVWLFSSNSNWLPRRHHQYLLRGMKEWACWPWFGRESDTDYEGRHAGALWSLLHDVSENKRTRFTLTAVAEVDLRERIEHAKGTLKLPETGAEIFERFIAEGVNEAWLNAQARRLHKRRSKAPPKRPR